MPPIADSSSSGVVSTYDGPLYASTLLGVTIFLLVVSMVAVALRFYVRACVVKSLGPDDWLLLPSLLLNILINGLVIACVEAGLGGRVEDVDRDDTIALLKYSAILRPVWLLTVLLVKLSLAFTLLRITTRSNFRFVIYALMISMTICNAVLFVLWLLSCRPYSAYWTQAGDPTHAKKCFSNHVASNLSWAFSVTDIFYNFALALLPVPILWRLQMDRRVKTSVVVILGLGLVASVAAIVRLHYTILQTHMTDMGEALARTSPLVVLWTAIEIGTGIIIAGMAACRPLFQSFFRVISDATGIGSNRSQSGLNEGTPKPKSRKSALPPMQNQDGDSTREFARPEDDFTRVSNDVYDSDIRSGDMVHENIELRPKM